MTPQEKLIELRQWINDQIYIETCRSNYNGTQRAIAYKRVKLKLDPILKQIKKIKNEFDF